VFIKQKLKQQHTKTVNKKKYSIMSAYTATMTKQSAAQSIGIGLKTNPTHGIFISSIDAGSPLAGSSLKIGMKLLSINGMSMANLTSKDAIKILKETEGKLVLTADNYVPAQTTFKMGLNAEGERYGTMVEHDINKATPTMFKEAGVPSETFAKIYKLVECELLPIAYENYKHTAAYNVQIGSYVGSQMVKGGMIGFGQESKEEKKVFQMVKQATQLQSSVDMKAAQVKDRANAMLAKYNIMATFALEETTLPRYSSKQQKGNVALSLVGLEFHKIE
jgi:hypothetical protein